MISPYPLRTEPLFRDYLWGGRKLDTVLGKLIPEDGVWAESWEMIDHPEHQSKVVNGHFAGRTLHEISETAQSWLFGDNAPQPPALPLLLKYLDCQKVLSVQVHPNDEYARRMSPPDLGKTEAWYIVDAEPGAKLYAGLAEGTTREDLRQAIEEGSVEACLHEIQPSAGDCIFIPAGTVHALGAGLLVAEIQQASNTTFRLFDWNRVDASGKSRELHVEQALEVIDFDSGPRELAEPQATEEPGRERLVGCDKFVLDRLRTDQATTVAGDGKFHLLTSPYGGVTLHWQRSANGETDIFADSLATGQSVLLPAAMPPAQIELQETAILLDMYLP